MNIIFLVVGFCLLWAASPYDPFLIFLNWKKHFFSPAAMACLRDDSNGR